MAQSPPDPGSLSVLLAALPALVVRVDDADRVTYLNADHAGRPVDAWVGRSWLDLFDSRARDGARSAAATARSSGASVRVVWDEGDGPRQHREAVVAPIPGEGGGLCVLGLEASRGTGGERDQERLRLAVDATGIALWSTDLRTGAVAWEDGLRAQSGLEPPRSFEEYVQRLVHPDDRVRFRLIVAQVVDPAEVVHCVHRIVRADGEVRWILTTARVVVDAAGGPREMLAGNLDITRQRTTEDQLRHAQRLESIGTLAAGIAHNFNNMLAVILPALASLRESVPPDDRELVGDAMVATERAADLVRQLTAFARPGEPARSELLAVELLVERTLRFCRGTFDRHVTLSSRIDPELVVRGDATAIEQILLNLLINARDAVQGRDEPVITVSAVDLPDPTRLHALGLVQIRVCDNGPGVPEPLRGRIFEPFFTTRAPTGTGLGLTTARALALAHGGALTCAEAPDGGALFTLVLPRAPVATPAVRSAGSAGLLPGLRILVVDDEPAVRRVTSRLLARLGASPTELDDGWAVARVLAEGAGFDAVLMDRSMPGPPTLEVVRQLRNACPGAAIVLFTGDRPTDEEIEQTDGHVQKPMSAQTLSEVVRGAIATRRARP